MKSLETMLGTPDKEEKDAGGLKGAMADFLTAMTDKDSEAMALAFKLAFTACDDEEDKDDAEEE